MTLDDVLKLAKRQLQGDAAAQGESMLLRADSFARWIVDNLGTTKPSGRAARACAKCGYDPDATIVQAFSFVVDRDPPSLNQRLFNTGPRAHLYRKERDLWCWEFRAKRLELKIPAAIPITAREAGRWSAFFGTEVVSRATNKRRVTLARIYGGRQKERDRDNLIGGMKACVDALVLEGLIGGDDPHSAELHYDQRTAEPGEATGLRVTIEVLA